MAVMTCTRGETAVSVMAALDGGPEMPLCPEHVDMVKQARFEMQQIIRGKMEEAE